MGVERATDGQGNEKVRGREDADGCELRTAARVAGDRPAVAITLGHLGPTTQAVADDLPPGGVEWSY